MPQREIKKHFETTASLKQISSIILNVEEYKNFVPHCVHSKILKQEEGFIMAEITISFLHFKISYTSEINFEFFDNMVIIKVTESKNYGVKTFKHLFNKWVIRLQNNKAEVDFFVDFEVTNFILNKVASASLPFISEIVLQAFLKKVQTL
jgi:ribosome-associated toxin RatA of RatAB toxin-antitoxin module